MTTSLQFLHQNLGDLRYCKLQDNERFKELYDEAKNYEKHANLTSLVSRSKIDKLAQETNFYLILTKMLAELKSFDQHETNFSSKLDKVYKWYLINKKPNPKDKQKLRQTLNQVSKSVNTMTPFNQVDKNLLSYRTEIEQQNASQAVPTKPPTPSVQLPAVVSKSGRNSAKQPQTKLTNKSLTKESQSFDLNNDDSSIGKLPELVNKPMPTPNSGTDLLKLSPVSSSMESYQKFKALEDVKSVKIETNKRMSEENRVGILKALSQYANKLYTSLDTGYTKKLESHLNSLSKFYHALDEDKNKTENFYDMTKFFTIKDKTETLLTGNALVDMAKQVSDKMILAKTETMIRQNEYKMSIEKSMNPISPRSPKQPPTEEDITNQTIDKMLQNTAEPADVQMPVYSVMIKNQKRPKSTPHMDWRGHVSRPNTVNTRSSSFKLMPSFRSRAKTTPQNLDDDTDESEFSDIEVEDELNKEYEEFISEKAKPLRRKSMNTTKKPKSIETDSKTQEAKEVKFLSFVKKLEDTPVPPKSPVTNESAHRKKARSARVLSTIRSQTEKSRMSLTKSRLSTANHADKTEKEERADSPIDSIYVDMQNSGDVMIKKDKGDVSEKAHPSLTCIDGVASVVTVTGSTEKSVTNPSVNKNHQSEVSIVSISGSKVDTSQSGKSQMSISESEDKKIKQLEMYQCLHNEIAYCECCNNKNSSQKNSQHEHPTPVTSNADIFHLTAGGQVENDSVSELRPERLKKERSIDFEQEEEDLIGKHDLRDILLANYDPKFAAKIGVVDFVPIEIMNDQNNKQLEFIPFENIDRNYPKFKGKCHYDPNFNQPPKTLYRTNPSIPRPESKYGTRSSVYDQILTLKQNNLETTALVVYEPEDVHLVRDLLQIQHRPLEEVLQCLPLRTDDELAELKEREQYHINLNMTPMGRPVNAHPQVRWKQIEMIVSNEEKESEHYPDSVSDVGQVTSRFYDGTSRYSFIAKENSEAESVHTHKKNTNFQLKLTGNPYKKDEFGRPIPHVLNVESPSKIREAFDTYNEAKKSVHIPTLFKEIPTSLYLSMRELYDIPEGSVIHNYVKELNLEERLKREEEQKAAIRIQQTYREHIKRKKNIEKSAPMTPEALNWIRNQKLELKKRKQEKENILRIQEQMLIKENLKLRNTLKHVGMHNDLFEILYHKGPEYTNGVLNEAATCIQRWVKGWLIRKEFDKLKQMIIVDGSDWSSFIKHYRKTFKRILLMRGDHKTQFDFKVNEAVEFYKKEKKYLSYYQKLCFVDQLEHSDLEKLFHYNDLYPTASELKEAKDQVLKYYKKKSNTNNYPKNIAFDIIYYIYPPLVTKLKSTRKSTWLNPIVGREDALRLRGYKFIEEANYENSWQLVAQSTLSRFSSINKNTPEVLEMVDGLNSPQNSANQSDYR